MLTFNRKRNWLFIIGSTFLWGVLTLINIKLAYGADVVQGYYSVAAYYQQTSLNNSSLITILVTVLVPFCYSYQVIYAKRSHFNEQLILRYSRRDYYWAVFKSNSYYAAIYYGLYHLTVLATSLMVLGIPTDKTRQIHIASSEILTYFSTQYGLNLFFYFIFSIIGMIIFANLTLVIGLWLKNTVLYFALGLIIQIIGMLVPSMINAILHTHNPLILKAMLIEYLLSPSMFAGFGNYSEQHSIWLIYILTVLFYSLIAVIVFKVWTIYREER